MGLSLQDVGPDATFYPVVVGVTALCLVIFRYISPALARAWVTGYPALSGKDSVVWNLTSVSMLHCTTVSALCVYAFWTDEKVLSNEIWHDSPVVRCACAVVCGYLLFDLIIITVYYKYFRDVGYFFHHAASIYAYYFAMSYRMLPFFANFRLLAELSTPCLNVRWYLTVLGCNKSSGKVILNAVCFALSFFLFRVLAMPVFWTRVYTTYAAGNFAGLMPVPVVLVITCSVLDSLNLFWFSKILRGAVQVFRSSSAGISDKGKLSRGRNTKSVKAG